MLPASGPSAPLIDLAGVHLKLASAAGSVNILRGVDLAIAAGETVGLVGASGSGKSTLMMVMGGLERATAGRVMIDGVDLNTLDEDGLARFRSRRIGIVFQAFHLIASMSALENVAIPLELAGVPHAFAKAADLLALVGLKPRSDHYPGQLSGGEQQRVALARAFAGEPKILLADEPTGNLDRTTGGKIMDLMFELNVRMGTTMILITHDPVLAERCGRTVEMGDGVIVPAVKKPMSIGGLHA